MMATGLLPADKPSRRSLHHTPRGASAVIQGDHLQTCRHHNRSLGDRSAVVIFTQIPRAVFSLGDVFTREFRLQAGTP